MDAIHEDIKALTEKELNAANENFPLFASMHEGAAVIFEEYEETREEMENVKKFFDLMWKQIRLDSPEIATQHASRLKFAAQRLAVEAVQVAAMAQKFIDSERGVK